MSYIGRFAPSPTGPLHMGSLVAALISYLEARSNNGLWLLRIEDLDPPREDPAAPDLIMTALDSFGLQWDGEVLYQSSRLDAYSAALHQLQQQGDVFPCSCSRKMAGTIYKGHCRHLSIDHQTQPVAIRMKVPDKTMQFYDHHLGLQTSNLAQDCGDFIIKRKDNLFAYQLAVVVDDGFQNITHIVRGIDLLESTPRQIHLQHHLNLTTPEYLHFPVLAGADGHKLSKQTFAPPANTKRPVSMLLTALQLINHEPPADAFEDNVNSLLAWAVDTWRPEILPSVEYISYVE